MVKLICFNSLVKFSFVEFCLVCSGVADHAGEGDRHHQGQGGQEGDGDQVVGGEEVGGGGGGGVPC